MTYSLRKLAALGLALALLASTTSGAQETTWYQVELIIFEQVNTADLASERWPVDPGKPSALEAAIVLDEPDQGLVTPYRPGAEPRPVPYRRLEAQALQLTPVHRSLERAAHMQPILHAGWRQPVASEQNARPIRIRGGRTYFVSHLDPDPGAPSSVTVDRPRPAPPWARPTAWSQSLWQPGVERVPAIEGTIVLSRARYLHIETDLVYTRPMPASIRDARPPLVLVNGRRAWRGELLRVRLRAHRRMRSDELHYIDHPGFGVLVRLTPYEIREGESRADTETDLQPGAAPAPE